MADAYQMDIEEINDMIGEFEKKSIREDICIRKAADFVVENAVEK